jgi:predicted ATP-binding protein involved in virulence
MRLDRIWIRGMRNLEEIEVDFDEGQLTTVIIGQNGSGKSNLIEAIVNIFRNADLNEKPPAFDFELDYQISGHKMRLRAEKGKWEHKLNDENLTLKAFRERKNELLPDLVFGYYSGGNNRLEKLFEKHQENYYKKVIAEGSEDSLSIEDRRLFYCRPIHGVMALLSFFANPDEKIQKLLKDQLGIMDFRGALLVLRKPSWVGSRKAKPEEFWGAKGLPVKAAQTLRDSAFFPLVRSERENDDYRSKGTDEEQYCMFLRNQDALKEMTQQFKTELQFFEALESMDISDLIRSVQVWVTRTNNQTGEVSFGDLSDGERQLLMVLGLIRLSRGKQTLFLLDEPDTHLNPVWQQTYLDLIRKWTQTESSSCQFILTSHNPLTISALTKNEVRVMYADENNKVQVKPPYTDPRGLGFTATLTEIFGLNTTLDLETQQQLDERNTLAIIDQRTADQEKKLIEINDKLNRLGFMYEDREPLYQDFLRAWKDVRYADRPLLTPDEIQKRQIAMSALLKSLMTQQEKHI